MKKSLFFKTALASFAMATVLPAVLTAQTKIYIDPGHGGSDPGAVNGTFGTQEADRVLFTGLELRDFLNDDTADSGGGGSWTVRMSRTTDVSVGLTARSVDSNNWGSSRFLSIHQNAFNQSANGTETFSYNNSGSSPDLRNKVQDEAIQAWGLVNRGNKTANFSVLRQTSAPAILTEMGFIDSPTDHPKCSSNVQCALFAKGMGFAIQRHFGLAEYDPNGAPPPPTGTVVDNGGSGYSEAGSWATSSSPGFYGGGSRYALVFNQPNNTATFTPNLSQSGEYEVYAWWVAGSNRSPGAVFEVNHLNGTSTVVKNQTTGGGQWNLIGTYDFNGGTGGNIKLKSAGSLNGGSSGTVISADAVQFVRIGNVTPTEVIVDNTDAGFTAPSSNWFPSTSVSGYLGSNYSARATASVSDAATWAANLPTSGSYEVFVRWTTGSNRATSAPYIVYHTGGSTTFTANQQANNGVWMSLGSYNFNAGTSTRVALSCWTGSGAYVIADGVRFVKQ